MEACGSRRLCLFFLLLLLFSFLSSLIYQILLIQTFHMQQYLTPGSQRNVSILLWHWPFGHSYSLSGDKCLEMTGISNCSLTDDRSTYLTADVVVFHHYELSNRASALLLHLPRPTAQRWVWLSMEPPINNANVKQFNGVFNWTMSYRHDADIPIPYGKTLPGAGKQGFQRFSDRSCFASWVVSKYKPNQTRNDVYQSLKKYIPIQVYGAWNKKPLPDDRLLPTISNCLFYLSFENSEAKDYISEKMWRNAFQAGAVPVVLGPRRATYEAVAPPHSFIHVADFKSVAELAAYLYEVAADKQAYEEYFKWHQTHRIKTYTDWRERLCQICLKYPSLPSKNVYQDLEGWVNS
ncbi:alpha-(1,3)-fucosyltransferase 7-like [Girardinichthys multiradiatus]|uniref:alpha-(1,3)-fucosyltransferase 7-like n=1 Tax=Girardinichthys multiradiatus TaxID=208333 RepID=UPI001FAB3689|nr:alpha-(1,3)-fucosyltransferase 7-like [Girardinichthys multiradiatus]XP_047237955.1 alpha-(1,3)-fucosyltransferase 7-like [Girardinichthys multiradiatus]